MTVDIETTVIYGSIEINGIHHSVGATVNISADDVRDALNQLDVLLERIKESKKMNSRKTFTTTIRFAKRYTKREKLKCLVKKVLRAELVGDLGDPCYNEIRKNEPHLSEQLFGVGIYQYDGEIWILPESLSYLLDDESMAIVKQLLKENCSPDYGVSIHKDWLT